MIAQINNYTEMTFVTCIILFADPFTFIGFSQLVVGAVIVFGTRIFLETWFSGAVTNFFRKLKKRIFSKNIKK